VKPYLGWLALVAVLAAWWITSRPDPLAEQRANHWQQHAESLAARVTRERRTFQDTIKVYYRQRDSARASVDSALAVPTTGTIVPVAGTCDTIMPIRRFALRLQPLIARERGRSDSVITVLSQYAQMQDNHLIEYQGLADSLQSDLRRAIRRGRGKLGVFVGPMVGLDGKVGVGIGVGLRF
jgi:hypothetical protein